MNISEREPTLDSLPVRLQWCLLHLYILGICGILLAAFFVQFGLGDAPCTLCLLQRCCMILAALGPTWIIATATGTPASPLENLSRGFGISVIASVLGLTISARQILMHIAPGDPGSGIPIFGYHLTTWSFIIFWVILLISGTTLLFSRSLAPTAKSQLGRYSKATLALLGSLIFANVVVVFFTHGAFAPLVQTP